MRLGSALITDGKKFVSPATQGININYFTFLTWSVVGAANRGRRISFDRNTLRWLYYKLGRRSSNILLLFNGCFLGLFG